MKRIEDGNLIGVIDEIVISETLFNCVVDRIAKREEIDPRAVVRKTKKSPELIGKTDISEVIEIFSIPNIYLTTPRPKAIFEKLGEVHSENLLSNDAFHLLAMRSFQVEEIATNDQDFERIDKTRVWKP